MKRFTFRLEAVLRHRETVLGLREQDFTQAQGRHAAALLELQALQAHYRDTVSRRPAAEVGTRFDAPSLQSREKYLEAVQVRITEQSEQVELARIISEEKRVAMVAAKQAHEAVSRLRERDHAEYLVETQRTTQAGLDEVASMQFGRQQSEERRKRADAAREELARTEDIAGEQGPDGRKAA